MGLMAWFTEALETVQKNYLMGFLINYLISGDRRITHQRSVLILRGTALASLGESTDTKMGQHIGHSPLAAQRR
jgi:hypothetical protein